MTFSTRTQNAVSIMIAIAEQQGKRATVKALAERTGLSCKYCEQIGGRLRAAGLVKSFRGALGGYVLARPAIAVRDVVRAVDEPHGPSADPRDQPIEAVFEHVQAAAWGALDGTALEMVE
ncbi:MAG: RrF2 family transcriptional regulator [Planctomycetota bacterium]|jgi:Rrf2 family cysteine metabolism transcriptional repressor